jgi:hypothetical protein
MIDGFHSMIVSNSWGMFHPSWDFPPGSPGRYADNTNHPFNIIISSLSAAGADILFAAGNCGPACPDPRCIGPAVPGPATATINGANSHPDVISVAGVDTKNTWVGYSSKGPGALAREKPDIAAYTHFLGSEAFGKGTPDSGTSAACPVMAGVVAGMRSVVSFDSTIPKRSPSSVKDFLLDNASPGRLATGATWTDDLGWGIVNTTALVNAQSVLT